jgi:hypothetical protein
MDELRDTIRKRIRSVLLPGELTARLYAGPGEGGTCGCCDQAILQSDIEYDFVLGDGKRLVMHLNCFPLRRQSLKDPEAEPLQPPDWRSSTV